MHTQSNTTDIILRDFLHFSLWKKTSFRIDSEIESKDLSIRNIVVSCSIIYVYHFHSPHSRPMFQVWLSWWRPERSLVGCCEARIRNLNYEGIKSYLSISGVKYCTLSYNIQARLALITQSAIMVYGVTDDSSSANWYTLYKLEIWGGYQGKPIKPTVYAEIIDIYIWTACCNTYWLKACVANWSWRMLMNMRVKP
jgi:hypothetical protein